MPRIVEVPEDFLYDVEEAIANSAPVGLAPLMIEKLFDNHNVPRPDVVRAAPEGRFPWQPPAKIDLFRSLMVGGLGAGLIWWFFLRPKQK